MKKVVAMVLLVLFTAAAGVPAFAAEMVQSIENKKAPQIVEQTTKDGKKTAAVVYDEDGNELGAIEDLIESDKVKKEDIITVEVVITPLDDKEEALPEIGDKLESGYVQVQEVEKPSELTEEVLEACKELGIDEKDLIVTEIFDVSLVINGVTVEEVPEGMRVKVILKTNYSPKQNLILLHNTEGTTWEVVDFEISENGDISFMMNSLSPFAILTDKTAVTGGGDGDSPKSGESAINNIIIVSTAIVLLGTAAYCFAKVRTGKKES